MTHQRLIEALRRATRQDRPVSLLELRDELGLYSALRVRTLLGFVGQRLGELPIEDWDREVARWGDLPLWVLCWAEEGKR